MAESSNSVKTIGNHAAAQARDIAKIRSVSPGLAKYAEQLVFSELGSRDGLSARDRSVVTVAAVIARHLTPHMRSSFADALDNGVKASELSEIITHLSFYSGWLNGMSAVDAAADIFAERKIDESTLPAASPVPLPLDEAAETQRATNVEANFGAVSEGVVHYTGELLFKDLWLRPDLSPRDRSLVTVSALISSGQALQVTYHLNRAMNNGLTKAQVAEVLTHLAFYAGWPNVFTAMPVVKDVLANRQN
jgi:4-carboxymuconolactone decarboxylase